jgi:hypothetical protein
MQHVCVGPLIDIKPDFASNPAKFHEELCRQSFMRRPVFGVTKGCAAQRALFHGTLENGKVAVEERWVHGRIVRELIAKVRFEWKADVTCYGGMLAPARKEKDTDTHMRHIPQTNHVLEGRPFSECFPVKQGAVFGLGYTVPLRPRCVDPAWDKVIENNGIGYMANTVTRCPLSARTKTNVVVCEAFLGRNIPGIPYANVMVLRAAKGGIDIGQPIISPYEPWKLKKKFCFKCVEPEHYLASGREQTFSDESDGSSETEEDQASSAQCNQ